MPSDFTALSLSGSPARQRADALHTLSERLLDLLAEYAPEDAVVRPDVFRAKLAAWRNELRAEDDPGQVSRLTLNIVTACAAFLDRTRAYHVDREGELADLVRVLREAEEAVRGTSLKFEKDLLRSAS